MTISISFKQIIISAPPISKIVDITIIMCTPFGIRGGVGEDLYHTREGARGSSVADLRQDSKNGLCSMFVFVCNEFAYQGDIPVRLESETCYMESLNSGLKNSVYRKNKIQVSKRRILEHSFFFFWHTPMRMSFHGEFLHDVEHLLMFIHKKNPGLFYFLYYFFGIYSSCRCIYTRD